MGVNEAAAEVLRSVGGKRNVLANSLCMTRLRIRVANPTIVDKKALNSIEGVAKTNTSVVLNVVKNIKELLMA